MMRFIDYSQPREAAPAWVGTTSAIVWCLCVIGLLVIATNSSTVSVSTRTVLHSK